MAQKSKKAKPDDHETNDSAIRLIGFLAPMEQKSKKAKPYDHETNDSAIWLICLFGSHVRRSKKARAKSAFLLWLRRESKSQKAESGFLAHWWGTIGSKNWLRWGTKAKKPKSIGTKFGFLVGYKINWWGTNWLLNRLWLGQKPNWLAKSAIWLGQKSKFALANMRGGNLKDTSP